MKHSKSQATNSSRSFAGLAALLAAFPAACRSLPPVKRLVTDPPGARVWIPRLNLELETPCDLPDRVGKKDLIRISAPGKPAFEGKLGDLPQVAERTYRYEFPR